MKNLEKEKFVIAFKTLAENLYGYDYKNYYSPKDIKFLETNGNGLEAELNTELSFVNRFVCIPVYFSFKPCPDNNGYKLIAKAFYEDNSASLDEGLNPLDSLEDFNAEYIENINVNLRKFLDEMTEIEEEIERKNITVVFSKAITMFDFMNFVELDTVIINFNIDNEGTSLIPIPVEPQYPGGPDTLKIGIVLSISGLHGSNKFFELTFIPEWDDKVLSEYCICAYIDEEPDRIIQNINENFDKMISNHNIKIRRIN